MVKIISIRLTGFKDPEREVYLEFSKTPITVIFGENGSGKTTFLKVIHAILEGDTEYLANENIKKIKIVYTNKGKEEKQLIEIPDLDKYKEEENRRTSNSRPISRKEKNKETKEIWKDINALQKATSVLFGVNRGITGNDINGIDSDELRFLLRRFSGTRLESDRLSFEMDRLLSRGRSGFVQGNWYETPHILFDYIGIKEIENAIVREYRQGQDNISERVKNAFFDTISSAVDIDTEEDKTKFDLPDNFSERIEARKKDLISLVEKLERTKLQKQILDYLSERKMIDSRIFRKILIDILEAVEKEDAQSKAINKLMEVFNGHLYRSKKLIVTKEKTYINLENGQTHELDKLSSGERHLLTFLTLFLVIGRDRNFFIIDEPEISLNMKWQRELLPLLSELNPNAQIIVATHSPSIVHKNPNFLVKLD